MSSPAVLKLPTFRLRDEVHLCETSGRFVVLDLAADRYVGLAREQSAALRATLADPPSHSAVTGALRPLLDAGLLTETADSGRPLAATRLPVPDRVLFADATATDGRVTAARLLRFVRAAVASQRRLRRRPIADTVAYVRRLRTDHDGTIDLAAARDLTAAFLRLRPIYPLNRRCLFESLALVVFLARYGVHPSWVFGVRLDPWRAHCWVQHEGLLFNDELDEVAQYTPIMAV